jgi:hypothetical protein
LGTIVKAEVGGAGGLVVGRIRTVLLEVARQRLSERRDFFSFNIINLKKDFVLTWSMHSPVEHWKDVGGHVGATVLLGEGVVPPPIILRKN